MDGDKLVRNNPYLDLETLSAAVERNRSEYGEMGSKEKPKNDQQGRQARGLRRLFRLPGALGKSVVKRFLLLLYRVSIPIPWLFSFLSTCRSFLLVPETRKKVESLEHEIAVLIEQNHDLLLEIQNLKSLPALAEPMPSRTEHAYGDSNEPTGASASDCNE